MATHKSATALKIAQAKRFANFVGDIHEAHKALVEAAHDDAQELTSGTVTAKQLRREGHPFGRSFSGTQRGGNARGRRRRPRLPINRQTGHLQRSRYLSGPTGGNKRYRLGHNAPHARFVLRPGGTRFMVDRGYFAEIRSRHRARKQGLLMAARRRQKRP